MELAKITTTVERSFVGGTLTATITLALQETEPSGIIYSLDRGSGRVYTSGLEGSARQNILQIITRATISIRPLPDGRLVLRYLDTAQYEIFSVVLMSQFASRRASTATPFEHIRLAIEHRQTPNPLDVAAVGGFVWAALNTNISQSEIYELALDLKSDRCERLVEAGLDINLAIKNADEPIHPIFELLARPLGSLELSRIRHMLAHGLSLAVKSQSGQSVIDCLRERMANPQGANVQERDVIGNLYSEILAIIGRRIATQ